MPATSTACRALEPRPADARHRLVPRHRNSGSINPHIGRPSGEQVGFFTPLEPRRCIFCQPAALQEHPDIEARVGFDDQVVGHAGVVMVVAQTETANHECETKARQGCRSRGKAGPGLPNRKHNLHDPLELDLDMLRERHLFPQDCPQLGVERGGVEGAGVVATMAFVGILASDPTNISKERLLAACIIAIAASGVSLSAGGASSTDDSQLREVQAAAQTVPWDLRPGLPRAGGGRAPPQGSR